MLNTIGRDLMLLEAVKGNEHYLLTYRNTPTGRLEAMEAVQAWLIECELDFNGHDAVRLWRAINRGRLGGLPDCRTLGHKFDANRG